MLSTQMDDRFFYGATQAFVVASLDMCLARIWHCCSVHCSECAPWSNLPRHVPCGRTDELWSIRKLVVYIKPWCNGVVSVIYFILDHLDRSKCWLRSLMCLISDRSIWYGVQASIGGDCVKVMLRAMWPSVNNIRRSFLPVSGHAARFSRNFLCV